MTEDQNTSQPEQQADSALAADAQSMAEAKPARKRAARKTPAKSAEAESALTEAVAEGGADADAAAVKPARKTRAKKAPAAPELQAAAATPRAELEPASAAATPEAGGEAAALQSDAVNVVAADAAAEGAEPAPAASEQTERRPRGQRRDKREFPNRGKQVPISDEPVEALAFGDIIAGALDVEEAPDAPGFPKRVLPPQPELPKLHKVLAQAGLGSRLEMERMIAEGAISVNNQPAHVGQRIQWGDKVRVKGKLLRLNIAPPMPRVLAYHKPAGEVVTHDDPQNRPTVFRKLPRLQQGKWQSVGRLDLNTEGLLLFTSSGELANRMMHPSFGLEREYAARVLGALSPEEKEQLLAGIELEDGPAQFGSISEGGGEGANQWYQVTIHEGRNREVRRMFETLGHAVSRLIRIRYGVVQLPRGLRRGFYMELGERDVKALMEAAGMSTQERKGPMTRIDPKREQARARGLRRAQPKAGSEMAPDFQADMDADWTTQEGQIQTADGERRQGAGGPEQRARRTPFGRKRSPGGQGKGPGRSPGQGGYGAAGGDFPREQGQPRPQRDRRGQGQQPYDADDEFSQRGVSHESPFEAKASRKKIFSSGNQLPDIIKAQRGAGGAGRGGKRGGGQGGIDPMRTSLGFIGGDSYRGAGGNGNKRSGGAGRGGKRGGRGGR